MCGITGFIDQKGDSSYEILERMNQIQSHRGPDGGGCYFSRKGKVSIGLAHRRLAVIDLSPAGKQPRTFGKLHITFNGEIYNYKEIRSELESFGSVFQSNSDTEVVIQSFAKLGKDCLHRLTGMFAFAIYNEENGELFCARDRAGVKPFYYYHYQGLFLFASELKALHEHPDFKKEIDPKALNSFLQFGNVPGSHCIFKHGHKLSPGHYLQFGAGSAEPVIKQYWNVYDHYNKPKLKIGWNEAMERTESVLSKAFNYRMVSDVPIGVFLSGGYDSACLTALLAKESNSPLHTFTIAVPDIGLNEAPHAKKVASHLGTIHNEFSCTEKEALEIIPQLPFYYDEPFGDQSSIPTTLVSKMARKQVTVALSADAGDEVFAGYNRYDYLMRHGKKLQQMPAPVRKAIHSIMSRLNADHIPIARNAYNFAGRYEKLKSLLQDPSPTNLMLNLSKQFTEDGFRSLINKETLSYEDEYLSHELKKEFHTPLSYMMAIDYNTYLPDDILQKVDRASMACSLEAREPFLDHHVIEWAAQLPDEFKYNNGVKKYILRKIVHRYIPESMMDRPKMGFAIPLDKWLNEALRPLLLHHLEIQNVKADGHFNPIEIERIKRAFLNGKREYTQKIWYLLMYFMWKERWMS